MVRPAQGTGTPGASDDTSSGTPGGADLGGQVRSAAEEAMSRAREESIRLASQARERAASFAESQKEAAAGQVGEFAEALRRTAENLSDTPYPSLGQYASQAAEGLDRLASSLRSRDLATLLDDVESFARRQPAVFIGGTVLGGFLLARFLKSSTGRHEDGSGRGRYTPSTTPGGPGGEEAGVTTSGTMTYPSSETTSNTLAGAAGTTKRSRRGGTSGGEAGGGASGSDATQT